MNALASPMNALASAKRSVEAATDADSSRVTRVLCRQLGSGDTLQTALSLAKAIAPNEFLQQRGMAKRTVTRRQDMGFPFRRHQTDTIAWKDALDDPKFVDDVGVCLSFWRRVDVCRPRSWRGASLAFPINYPVAWAPLVSHKLISFGHIMD